jgi:hypothetical protein
MSNYKFITLEGYYEITVALKLKAINLKKRKLLNGKLIYEEILSVGRSPR